VGWEDVMGGCDNSTDGFKTSPTCPMEIEMFDEKRMRGHF